MAVRSAVLAANSALPASVSTTLCTVPLGETWLVKSIASFTTTAGGGSLRYSVNPGGGTGISFVEHVLAVNVPQMWNGWVVMEPGDELRVVNGSGTMIGRTLVSGSMLLGVA